MWHDNAKKKVNQQLGENSLGECNKKENSYINQNTWNVSGTKCQGFDENTDEDITKLQNRYMNYARNKAKWDGNSVSRGLFQLVND